MFQYLYAWLILCNVGEVYIFELEHYASALGYVRVLILSNYILLECINKTDKYLSRLGDLMRYINYEVLILRVTCSIFQV